MVKGYKCTVYQISRSGKSRTWLCSFTKLLPQQVRTELYKLAGNMSYPKFEGGTILYTVIRGVVHGGKVAGLKLMVPEPGYKFVDGVGLVRE